MHQSFHIEDLATGFREVIEEQGEAGAEHQLFDGPSGGSADRGEGMVDGPDVVAQSETLEAAAMTNDRLSGGTTKAGGQRFLNQKGSVRHEA